MGDAVSSSILCSRCVSLLQCFHEFAFGAIVGRTTYNLSLGLVPLDNGGLCVCLHRVVLPRAFRVLSCLANWEKKKNDRKSKALQYSKYV